MNLRLGSVCSGLLLALLTASPALAGDPVPPTEGLEAAFPERVGFSPYAGRSFPDRPLWGDTHLHTNLSMDAGAFGAKLSPDDAYRFAKGAEIVSSGGLPVRLSKPLDFLVVADHSDNMGFFPRLLRAAIQRLLADPTGKPVVRHDERRAARGRRRSRSRSSQNVLPGELPARALSRLAGHRRPTGQRLGSHDPTRRRSPQRSGPLHGLHWLRVDLEHGRQQPAPRGDPPRRREPGRCMVEPYTTLKPQGSDNPATSGSGCSAYEDQDRRPACSPSPTTATSEQRHHVPHRRFVHGQSGGPAIGLRRGPGCTLGAAGTR